MSINDLTPQQWKHQHKMAAEVLDHMLSDPTLTFEMITLKSLNTIQGPHAGNHLQMMAMTLAAALLRIQELQAKRQ